MSFCKAQLTFPNRNINWVLKPRQSIQPELDDIHGYVHEAEKLMRERQSIPRHELVAGLFA